MLVRLAYLIPLIAPPLADLFRGDEPAPSDGDLTAFRREVPDARNGFLLLDMDPDELDWVDDLDRREPSDFDHDAAAKAILENEAVFARVEAALVAPDFQLPFPDSTEDDIGYLLAFRSLTYAISGRGRYRFETGNEEAALGDAVLLVRLGRRIQGAQGFLSCFLVGVAVQSIGCTDLLERLEQTRLGPEALARVLDALAPIEVDVRGFQDALRAEYVLVSCELDQCTRMVRPSSDVGPLDLEIMLHQRPFFRLERTKRLLGEDIRAILEAAGAPPAARRLVPLTEKYRFGELKRRLLTCGGEVGLRKIVTGYERSLGEVRFQQFQLAATKVLLALECHRGENGGLPASLDGLVPRFLKTVPTDPYDGKPLRWSIEKLEVYSVGSDLVDSGGSAEKEWQKALTDGCEPTARLRAR